MALKKRLPTTHLLIIILSTFLLYIGLSNNIAQRPKTFGKNIQKQQITEKENHTDIESYTEPYQLTWSILENIDFTEKDDAFYGLMLYPVLTENLRQKKGKTIQLSGYIIPMDDETYVLSKNVMASCFFCGVGGAETIAGLNFKGEIPRLATDTYLTIQGVFTSNETNPDDWIYTIEQAIIIKKEK